MFKLTFNKLIGEQKKSIYSGFFIISLIGVVGFLMDSFICCVCRSVLGFKIFPYIKSTNNVQFQLT